MRSKIGAQQGQLWGLPFLVLIDSVSLRPEPAEGVALASRWNHHANCFCRYGRSRYIGTRQVGAAVD